MRCDEPDNERSMMKVENWPIDRVKPYPGNPRKNDEAVDKVANSIREFGWQQSIVVDEQGVIVCGHTRYRAAQLLGLSEVPVTVAEGLTENQVQAYRLADNKTGELADWDFDKLNDELEAIDWLDCDMTQFGFYLDNEGNIDQSQEGAVPFATVLGSENNYIVLKFDTDIDWIQAQQVFGLREEKRLSTRKDGALTEKMTVRAIGRVIDGKKVMDMITGVNNENDDMLSFI